MTKEETCIASQYGIGDGYHGRGTDRANGQHLRLGGRAPHQALRQPRYGDEKANGRSVTVRINDHGPFVRRRCIDVSHAASWAIDMGELARVRVE